MIESQLIANAFRESTKEIALLLGGANIILVALIGYLGKIWTDRMIENERRKTQIILEQLKDSLLQDREKINQLLKTQLDQSRYFFEKSISYFSENQKSVTEKRLLAFEKLWKTVYEIRRLAPFYLDFILENEYNLLKTNSKLKKLTEDVDEQEVIKKYQDVSFETEALRIYIPPLTWQLYDSYKVIALRPALLTKMMLTSNSNSPPVAWYQDGTLKDLIISILDKEEIDEFNRLRLGQLCWILGRIEIKLIDDLQRYISGDVALEEMAEKAFILDKANRKAEESLYEIERGIKSDTIGEK